MESTLQNPKVRLAQILIHIFFTLFSVSIILPTALTLVVSFSSEMSVMLKGYSFFPDKFSVDAYRYVFTEGKIFNAYLVSLLVTIVGSLLCILTTSLAGYALSQGKLKYRNAFAFYLYIPTVISFGSVAWYYNIAYTLNLRNNFLALILPNIVAVFNIFLTRNYYKTIPASLEESAKIDGANPFIIFFKIALPLAIPVTATVFLFSALGYWNDFYLATWFVDNSHENLYPLMFYLQQLYYKMNSAGSNTGNIGSVGAPKETVYIATMFLSMGPILLVYPFVQKYFIKGIMIGAVKG